MFFSLLFCVCFFVFRGGRGWDPPGLGVCCLCGVFLFSFLKKFDPFPSSFPSLFPSGVGFTCRRRCRRRRHESTLSVVTARLGLVLRDVPLGVPKAEKGGEGAARRRLSQVPGLCLIDTPRIPWS